MKKFTLYSKMAFLLLLLGSPLSGLHTYCNSKLSSAGNKLLAADTLIIFISKDVKFDSLCIDALKKEGFRVVTTYAFPLKGNQQKIDSLNLAKVVIVGRSSVSSDIGPSKDAWNKSVTVPLMLMSQHSSAVDKLDWFNSTKMTHMMNAVTVNAYTAYKTDPVFNGVTFSGDSVSWSNGPEDITQLDSTTNGTILVNTNYLKNGVFVVRFDAGQTFYSSTCDKPFAPRTYFGMGINTTGAVKAFTFTSESKKVWIAEVRRLAKLQYTPYVGNTDATLTGITLNAGTLNPAFNASTTTYSATLPAGTSSVTVGVSTGYACAKVTGAGKINTSTGTGTASIMVTSEDGKTNSQTYTINFTVTPTGIENHLNSQFNIYPNPASSFLEVNIQDYISGTKLKIINEIGEIVLQKNLTSNSERLNIQSLKKGIYIIIIENNKTTLKQKIVIK